MPLIVRFALIQTVNQFGNMPSQREDLQRLRGRLDDLREANIRFNIELIAAAAAAGARAVCLNELFPAPYFCFEEDPMWRELAEDAEAGPTVRALARAAEENNVHLVAPLYELDRRAGKRYSTAVLISDRGVVLGRYRKTHVPQGEFEAGRITENYYFDRNPHPPYFPVFKTSVGPMGVCLGQDRHFPGVFSHYAAAGAALVFAPSTSVSAKDKTLWEPEIRTMAGQHRLFIGASNRRGAEAPWNRVFSGNGFFADPEGNRLENLSSHPNLVVSDLDLEQMRYPDPGGWDLKRDARPEIY